MARRPAYKKIYCVRAVYNPEKKPKKNFEELTRAALRKRSNVAMTKVAMSSLGELAVCRRHSEWKSPSSPLMIAIGGGAPREKIGTLGAGSTTDEDIDAPEAPPRQRAFKLADSFVLIEGDQLLICSDGALKGYRTVSAYFHELFGLANLGADAQAFQFEPKSNKDKKKTLEREGVKYITLKGTLYAASQELDKGTPQGLQHLYREFRKAVQEYFEEEIKDPAEKDALAAQWGELNVTTTISPSGGTRANPVILKPVDIAGLEALEEDSDDSEVIIKTRGGTDIKSGDVILSKKVSMRRKKLQRDLDVYEVWKELQIYMHDLKRSGAWGK